MIQRYKFSDITKLDAVIAEMQAHGWQESRDYRREHDVLIVLTPDLPSDVYITAHGGEKM